MALKFVLSTNKREFRKRLTQTRNSLYSRVRVTAVKFLPTILINTLPINTLIKSQNKNHNSIPNFDSCHKRHREWQWNETSRPERSWWREQTTL